MPGFYFSPWNLQKSRANPGWRGTLLAFWLAAALIGLCSCRPAADAPTSPGIPGRAPTFTPFQPLPPGATHQFEQPTASSVPAVETQPAPPLAGAEPGVAGMARAVWVDPLLPADVRAAIGLPQGWVATSREQASIVVGYGLGEPIADWYFALAAPFATLTDGVTSGDLRAFWIGAPPGWMADLTLVMSPFTLNALVQAWGPPATPAVQELPAADLLDAAWNGDFTWAVLPFEDLEPRWKVLAVDGISPIRNDFNGLDYALRVLIAVQGTGSSVEAFLRERPVDYAILQPTNRDPSRLTVLAMTGVTALVRATAYTMENIDVNYPGAALQSWLAGADLTHISNEVPFAEDCPFPNPVQENVVFCSDPRYITLLEFVGADIIELTGDHFHDWGEEATLLTLQMYQERGWAYYGGGYNLADGRKPLTLEHNGNRLAFIGCNAKGGEFASATVNSPGSASCDFAYMETEIDRLSQEGYLPIATFQHQEFYTYAAQPPQVRDFQRLASAGALIVSGSQAHQPQGMEFFEDAFLHYGLGNLFFDQYILGVPTRQGFIDRHVFYNNRYISTELLTIWFVDFAQARLMTPEERSDLLATVFAASGW